MGAAAAAATAAATDVGVADPFNRLGLRKAINERIEFVSNKDYLRLFTPDRSSDGFVEIGDGGLLPVSIFTGFSDVTLMGEEYASFSRVSAPTPVPARVVVTLSVTPPGMGCVTGSIPIRIRLALCDSFSHA